jgi:hypothetical protein
MVAPPAMAAPAGGVLRVSVHAMKDAVVLALLVMAFATLVTTHLVIVGRLMWRVTPRYRGLVALVVPPLAPFWAHGQRWRKLCWLWVGAVLVYASALSVAALGG